jgi:hypothetical protein
MNPRKRQETLFCQTRLTHGNTSKEHVLRRKWRRKYQLGEPGLHGKGWHREASINGPLITIDKVHADRLPFTWTAPGVVCKKCNNG